MRERESVCVCTCVCDEKGKIVCMEEGEIE